jgi:hypothetical protein
MKKVSYPDRLSRVAAVLACAVVAATVPTAAAPAPRSSSTNSFGVLAGSAVTCTASRVTGNVGVWPGTAVTQTEGCIIEGTVHAADAAAERAYLDFVSRYNALRDQPPACDETLTGTLAGQLLTPGVYCMGAVAPTGTLMLDGQGHANARWTFLVDGALEATNFKVVLINGAEACDVLWWIRDGATATTSTWVGTILAGAAITVTGGTFSGNAYAKAAVTLTGAQVTSCEGRAAPGPGPGPGPGGKSKCNQGVGNGPEGCDPGNSTHRNPSNDERGGTPGNPGRKGPGVR